jgi:6-phosphogluconate dehydrogenase
MGDDLRRVEPAATLDSFLIEITADILQAGRPVTGKPLVDVILDTAGQKGTGKWTSRQRARHGRARADRSPRRCSPAASSRHEGRERVAASQGPHAARTQVPQAPSKALIADDARRALLLEDLLATRRASQLMRDGAGRIQVERSTSARSPRSGAAAASSAPRFLRKITEAYAQEPEASRTCSSTRTSTRPSSRRRRTGARSSPSPSKYGVAGADLRHRRSSYFDSYRSRPSAGEPARRPSATTSARTPTSASTSRAASSSTSTGRMPSADQGLSA